MTRMNCSCQHDTYSHLTRSILIIWFIQVHELKCTPTHTHTHTHTTSRIFYSSTLCSCHVHTGIGRVSLHGDVVIQCSWFFWPNSLIGVFTTGRGEGAIAIKLTNNCRTDWMEWGNVWSEVYELYSGNAIYISTLCCHFAHIRAYMTNVYETWS